MSGWQVVCLVGLLACSVHAEPSIAQRRLQDEGAEVLTDALVEEAEPEFEDEDDEDEEQDSLPHRGQAFMQRNLSLPDENVTLLGKGSSSGGRSGGGSWGGGGRSYGGGGSSWGGGGSRRRYTAVGGGGRGGGGFDRFLIFVIIIAIVCFCVCCAVDWGTACGGAAAIGAVGAAGYAASSRPANISPPDRMQPGGAPACGLCHHPLQWSTKQGRGYENGWSCDNCDCDFRTGARWMCANQNCTDLHDICMRCALPQLPASTQHIEAILGFYGMKEYLQVRGLRDNGSKQDLAQRIEDAVSGRSTAAPAAGGGQTEMVEMKAPDKPQPSGGPICCWCQQPSEWATTILGEDKEAGWKCLYCEHEAVKVPRWMCKNKACTSMFDTCMKCAPPGLPADAEQIETMLGFYGMKEFLASKGLKDTGKKEDLVQRIVEHVQSPETGGS
eukprot:TRINITY_DN21754_c0_g1_i1.p1 TRINITY_DN21754_c0_g1~~TRINITY_DN21754_c0_g1_i1.p1  ORF type:complete len:442 (+),score=101.06 TRINITY_DN21754_c0_g1_i1:73-1398(+)